MRFLIGSGVVVAGYIVFGHGWSKVRGCNVTLKELAFPGAFTGCHPDSTYTGPNGADSGAFRQGAGNPPGGPLAPGKHKGGGIGA